MTAAPDAESQKTPILPLALAAGIGFLVCADCLNYAYTRADIEIALGRFECVLIFGYICFLLLAVFVRRVAAKLSLTALTLLVCLLLGEVGHWALAERRPFLWPPLLKRRHTAGTQLHGVPAETFFTTNSCGLRGPEPGPADRYRLLAVGGSTTECLYLNDDLTWPARLQARLNQAWGGGAWVGNAGRSGLTAYDHLILLRGLPEARTSDAWLILCGLNDLAQMLGGSYRADPEASWGRNFGQTACGARRWRRPYHRNLFVYRWLESRWKGFAGSGVLQDGTAEWETQARRQRAAAAPRAELPPLSDFLAEYRRNLSELCREARGRHKRLILATQPVLWRADLEPELSGWLCFGRAAAGGYYTPAALRSGMDQFNAVMRQVAQAEQVELIDLAAQLPATGEIFYDDCHFHVQGAEAVARVMAEFMLSASPNGPPAKP